MTKVYSEALDATIEVERIIGKIEGTTDGPTLVFIGGIHGNEPAGVFAIKKVFSALDPNKIKGKIYALAGNLTALAKNERFIEEDLNRVWTQERMEELSDSPKDASNPDIAEQIEINNNLQEIIEKNSGPFYFFDLHTTSGQTLPFLTVNDSLLNRAYTSQYPIPIILGIEEYLEGPLLSYLNEIGYVAFGFEAGQHDVMASIENCICFIYLSLVYTGCLERSEIDYYKYHDLLAKMTEKVTHTFEILYRYLITNGEAFEMQPGYYNFQRIKQNQHLATSNGTPILAKEDGRIFMPLYQPKGSDGFFTIRQIWKPFLSVSAFIRNHRLDRILTWLPGIKWMDTEKSGIIVDKRIARFFAKEVFHLFGYRSVYLDKNHLKMLNREATAKTEEYEMAEWMN